MSTNQRATLAQWKSELANRTHASPYVGPRPQTGGDPDRMLVGRDADLQRIGHACEQRALVILDGYSGVGKSSLLQNGLYERLSRDGWTVLVSRNWSGECGATLSIESFIARGIRATHLDPAAPIPVPDTVDLAEWAENGGLCEALDSAHPNAAVLILDQFEEMLRKPGRDALDVFEWVKRIAFRHTVHVVVSLRTDSMHQLEPMLRGVKPLSMERIHIEEIADPGAIGEIIRRSRLQMECPVTEPATERLLALWSDHRPRLLELQATLYTLHDWARVGADGAPPAQAPRIGDLEITRLVAGAGEHRLDPFTFGLHEALGLKVAHAEEAARSVGLDEYLVVGTREMARRAARYLSSGGFKVPVEGGELAQRALQREIQVLAHALDRGPDADADPASQAAECFRQIRQADVLATRRPARASNALARRQIAEFHGQVTAGPMMSQEASEVLFEEARRVAFAVEWLIATEIARETDGTLLLVHDASGEALKAATGIPGSERKHALRQITAARGEHFDWHGDPIGPESGIQVIANLNWRDCRIAVDIRNVVLVNCDFTGSRFTSCAFRGVTFVNCLLDDVNFEYCVFVDPVTHAPISRAAEDDKSKREQTRLAPSFRVETSAAEVAAFGFYDSAVDGRDAFLFSDTSGRAARPGAPPDGFGGVVIAEFVTTPIKSIGGAAGHAAAGNAPACVQPTGGGVVIVGGRVCFLTLYRCRSENDGGFALHHVSGDGLDIVEHQGGRIDVHDGAIRGIAVTRDMNGEARADAAGAGHVELVATDSLLTNIVFSDHLRGSATFWNCKVLMLINSSAVADDGFSVELNNCRYQFLVNGGAPAPDCVEDSSEVSTGQRYFARVSGSESRFEIVNRAALAADLEKMDFRLRPHLWEEQQRRRRAARQHGEST